MQSVKDVHDKAEKTDKKFDKTVDNMVADRRKVREGYKFSEGDQRRMMGKKMDITCDHGEHQFENKMLLGMHNAMAK